MQHGRNELTKDLMISSTDSSPKHLLIIESLQKSKTHGQFSIVAEIK